MKRAILLLALLACAPAIAGSHGWRNQCPRWWTDQDQRPLRCDRCAAGPGHDPLRAICLKNEKAK
jgi:hypothetical protein